MRTEGSAVPGVQLRRTVRNRIQNRDHNVERRVEDRNIGVIRRRIESAENILTPGEPQQEPFSRFDSTSLKAQRVMREQL